MVKLAKAVLLVSGCFIFQYVGKSLAQQFFKNSAIDLQINLERG